MLLLLDTRLNEYSLHIILCSQLLQSFSRQSFTGNLFWNLLMISQSIDWNTDFTFGRRSCKSTDFNLFARGYRVQLSMINSTNFFFNSIFFLSWVFSHFWKKLLVIQTLFLRLYVSGKFFTPLKHTSWGDCTRMRRGNFAVHVR